MKTYLFVDGTNLYAAQYELFGPEKYLDFNLLARELEKQLKAQFNKIYFYASYSPRSRRLTKKQKAYLKNEGLFYQSVRKTRRTTFFKGYRSKTSGKEKEVDVKLSVDIVDFAHRDRYDSVYLFSGAAFFFRTYIVDFGDPIRVKFLGFQRNKFIKIDKSKLLKEAR